MKRRALTCLAIVFAGASLGCVHVDRDMYRAANAVTHSPGAVGVSLDHPCIGTGAAVVLRWSRFEHNPLVPFAFGGWAITLQLASHDFAPGTEFSLPTPSVAATLSFVGHHPGPSVNDLRGHVRVIAVGETYAEVSVDLKSPSLRWAERGKATFYLREPDQKRCA